MAFSFIPTECIMQRFKLLSLLTHVQVVLYLFLSLNLLMRRKNKKKKDCLILKQSKNIKGKILRDINKAIFLLCNETTTKILKNTDRVIFLLCKKIMLKFLHNTDRVIFL